MNTHKTSGKVLFVSYQLNVLCCIFQKWPIIDIVPWVTWRKGGVIVLNPLLWTHNIKTLFSLIIKNINMLHSTGGIKGTVREIILLKSYVWIRFVFGFRLPARTIQWTYTVSGMSWFHTFSNISYVRSDGQVKTLCLCCKTSSFGTNLCTNEAKLFSQVVNHNHINSYKLASLVLLLLFFLIIWVSQVPEIDGKMHLVLFYKNQLQECH